MKNQQTVKLEYHSQTNVKIHFQPDPKYWRHQQRKLTN